MKNKLNNNSNITEINKRLFALALPMAASQFINIASGFFCMAMVAKLGHQILAASALIFAIQMSIMVIGMSVLFSLSVLIGHAYGAKNYTMIGNFVQQGWTLALLISLPIILIFWHIDAILIYFGQAKAIAQIVEKFFHAYIWEVIPFLLSVCNQQLGYAVHKKRLIITCSMLSILVLLIMAYALIFGKFGMPQLGVAGLAYAMVAQSVFFCICTTLCFFYDKSFKRFDLFNYRVHQHWEHIITMFKIGWPISLQMGGELLSFVVNMVMVGWLSTNALAAAQVINQWMFLIIVPIFAFSQASGILIGHAYGEKKFTEIKQLGNSSIGLVLIATLLAALIFLLFPRALASLYLDVNNPENAQTLRLIILLFAILAVSQIFDGLRNVLTGTLRGLLDTKFSMVVSLCVIWLIGVPLSYLLAFPAHWGVAGILVGSGCGAFVGALIMFYRWHKKSSVFITSI